MSSDISQFLSLLSKSFTLQDAFNPWADVDQENDMGPFSPEIRQRQLSHYLESRLREAKYVLIGEAVGYGGGHFSGIAMTSERILLGFQKGRGIHPEHVLPALKPQRTSRPEIMRRGFAEPTATIVWDTIVNSSLRPTEFVLWNAFAWHPFNPKKGILSNRKPKTREMVYGRKALIGFLELFSDAIVIGVGKTSAYCLDALDTDFYSVRHPAQGGAQEFRSQFSQILDRTRSS